MLILFLGYAYCFYLGGIFTRDQGRSMKAIWGSFIALMNGVMGASQIFPRIPDLGNGVEAALRIFKILEGKTEEELEKDQTFDPNFSKEKLQGKIEFKNVSFKYSSREKNEVFNQLSLSVSPGMKVGLVGPSGCGIDRLYHQKTKL